jgi:hypothetical protein
VAPGVNSAHPAFNGRMIRQSSIAMLGNAGMVNLLNGRPNINVGTNFNRSTAFGPMVNPNGGFNGFQVPAVISSEVLTAFTAATIIYCGVASSGGQTLLTTNYAGGAATCLISCSASLAIFIGIQGIAFTVTPALPTLTGGHYYFFAGSSIGGFRTAVHRTVSVLVDLTTGVTAWGTSNSGWNTETVGANYGIGTIAAGGSTPAWVAASMMGFYYVPLEALLTWAADPWSFWYPRTIESTAFVSSRSSPPPPPVTASQARAVVMA